MQNRGQIKDLSSKADAYKKDLGNSDYGNNYDRVFSKKAEKGHCCTDSPQLSYFNKQNRAKMSDSEVGAYDTMGDFGTKKLIIIGRGRNAELGLQADGEKWAINFFIPGADVLFDIHTFEARTGDRAKAIAAGQRVITQAEYPLDEILKEFKTEYFSNSIPYMIALAIYQKYTHIDLYGCNVIPLDSEAPIVENHPGTEFWIGLAMGRGVKVTVHGKIESFLLRDVGMYGFSPLIPKVIETEPSGLYFKTKRRNVLDVIVKMKICPDGVYSAVIPAKTVDSVSDCNLSKKSQIRVGGRP